MPESSDLDDAVDWRAIGRAIFERRTELGMDRQLDLAERAGVHLNTISRIERGVPSSRRSPAWSKIEAALQWPGGHISRLADGESARSPDFPIPVAMAEEIERAVLAAISDVEPDVTLRQAREIGERTINELRRRELLPPRTAGLTSGSP
jgi:transcriptional regulator with XRE-family HTH domain